jgi:hypothetical protein
MTDFADLLYKSLPGLYRDKDAALELQRFLAIAAKPLEEIEQSIENLYLDFYLHTCRDSFVPLIGSLLGIELDPRLPAKLQRIEAANALLSYQRKGLAESLEGAAQQLTSFAVNSVDYSRSVATLPFLQDANPLAARRNQPVAEDPAGSGNFFFRPDQTHVQLYDGLQGRAISRKILTGAESQFAGVDGRFSIKQNGSDLFTRAGSPFVALAADLTDFAAPKSDSGSALVLAANQVAVDPVLGRFQIVSPAPARASLTTDYEELVPASLGRETFDLRDPAPITRLGLADDPAPYTIDLRSPRQPSESFGRMHFDNYGLLFTPGRVIVGGRPNLLADGPPTVFSFDGRPLAAGDTAGVALQLQDGLDGTPLTRAKLSGREAEYCGASRGFAIRISGLNLLDAGLGMAVNIKAADLSNPAAPLDAKGAVLVLAGNDVAVDPQLGRFVLNLAVLGTSSSQIRVDYLLGPARVVRNAAPAVVDSSAGLFSFSSDGVRIPLRDGFDGTLIASKLKLGRDVAEFHGTPRGWVVRRNGVDVSGTLTASIQPLESPAAVSAATIAINPARGRLQFPPGVFAAGDVVTVDFNYEDLASEYQLLQGFAQRAPRLAPAGVTAVIVDSRKVPVDPAVLL